MASVSRADLEIVLNARDEATQVLKKTNATLGDTEKQLGKTAESTKRANVAWGALAGVVGGALIGVLSDAARAAADEEAGMVRLDQALLNAGIASGEMTAAIETRIAAQQNALAFGDGPQRDSMSALVAITKDVNEAFKLQALAMDLARFKNIDLKTATDIIGKVYAGNLGALSRYGIVVEKGATATEALGAIQLITAGHAQRFGDSTAGSMEKVKLAVGDLQEEIGGMLGPLQGVIGLMPGLSGGMTVASGAAGALGVSLKGVCAAALGILGPLALVVGPLLLIERAATDAANAQKAVFTTEQKLKYLEMQRALRDAGMSFDAAALDAAAGTSHITDAVDRMAQRTSASLFEMGLAARVAGRNIPEQIAEGISDRQRVAEFAALRLANVTVTAAHTGVAMGSGATFDAGFSVAVDLGKGMTVGLEQTQLDTIEKTGFIPASMRSTLESSWTAMRGAGLGVGRAVGEGLKEGLSEAQAEALRLTEEIMRLTESALRAAQSETERTLSAAPIHIVKEGRAIVGGGAEKTISEVTKEGIVLVGKTKGAVPAGVLPDAWIDVGGVPTPIFGVPKLAQGGVMPFTGLAHLERGERVIPAGQQGGTTVIFNGPIYGLLDFERQIKTIVRDNFPRAVGA